MIKFNFYYRAGLLSAEAIYNGMYYLVIDASFFNFKISVLNSLYLKKEGLAFFLF